MFDTTVRFVYHVIISTTTNGNFIFQVY